jgi:drug/metabolite transporter (DMT)-like permease
MPVRYWLIIILVGATFGSSFLLIEIAARELTPLTMAAGRAVIAAAVCWIMVLIGRAALPRDPIVVLQLLGLGVLSYAFSFVLMPVIQMHITTGLVAMINLLLPIMTLVVAHFWPGGERASRRKIFGAAIGFAGAIVLAIPSFAAGVGGQAIGIVLCLCTTFAFALAFNITRSFSKLAPQSVAALAMSGAMLATLPPAILFEGLPTISLNETWIAWLALGLFPTAFTFQVMYWMLPRVGATNFSVNAYVSPVVATILGVTLLGETVNPLHLLGIAIVMFGLVVIDGRLIARLMAKGGRPLAR